MESEKEYVVSFRGDYVNALPYRLLPTKQLSAPGQVESKDPDWPIHQSSPQSTQEKEVPVDENSALRKTEVPVADEMGTWSWDEEGRD